MEQRFIYSLKVKKLNGDEKMPSQEELKGLRADIMIVVVVFGITIFIMILGVLSQVQKESVCYNYDTYFEDNLTGLMIYAPSMIIDMSRSNEEVLQSKCHEYTHYLIKNDYEHFCGCEE
jgi:hypothetical protein